MAIFWGIFSLYFAHFLPQLLYERWNDIWRAPISVLNTTIQHTCPFCWTATQALNVRPSAIWIHTTRAAWRMHTRTHGRHSHAAWMGYRHGLDICVCVRAYVCVYLWPHSCVRLRGFIWEWWLRTMVNVLDYSLSGFIPAGTLLLLLPVGKYSAEFYSIRKRFTHSRYHRPDYSATEKFVSPTGLKPSWPLC